VGLNFRKSIKLGKLVNLNIGKNDVGLSTGIKGARVSINKNGVGGSVGADGIRYSKRKSFENIAQEMPIEQIIKEKKIMTKKEFNEKQLIYIITTILFTVLSCFFPPLFFCVLIVFVRYLVFFFKNRNIK
jgi:hypothetical protein